VTGRRLDDEAPKKGGNDARFGRHKEKEGTAHTSLLTRRDVHFSAIRGEQNIASDGMILPWRQLSFLAAASRRTGKRRFLNRKDFPRRSTAIRAPVRGNRRRFSI
jgi:hypothetical protein